MPTQTLREITEETMQILKPEVKKAISEGYTLGLGLTGFELEAPSKKLFPVLSPFRNSVPRTHASVGSKAAHWQAIVGIGRDRRSPFVDFGMAGARAQTEKLDFMAEYKVIARDDFVLMDAQMLAQGYEDVRATAGINLLYLTMIDEDKVLLGGQVFSLPKPAQPTLTVNPGQGAIPANQAVHVRVRARTLQNWFYGGGSQMSDEAALTTEASGTFSVTARVAAVPGAVAYDWYVSGDGATWSYATTTVVNSVVITELPDADQPTPPLPELAPADTYAVASAADTSGNPTAFNGLLATLTGAYKDGIYVTPGTPGATPTGAVVKSLDGQPLTFDGGTVVEIADVLLQIWDNVKLSPTKILMSARERKNIAKGMVKSSGGGATYTVVQPTGDERANLQAGYAVQSILNPITDKPIPIEVMPHLPPGTLAIITETLPYPNNQVSNVFEVETQQEYQQIEYAMARLDGPNGGPRYEFEVRAIETFKNYFPAGCALISNIGE